MAHNDNIDNLYLQIESLSQQVKTLQHENMKLISLNTKVNKNKRSKITTSIKEIIEYWETRVYEGNLSVDFAEAHERCWRCGCKCTLHRCHIIPHSLGGKDDPSNMVLLCNRCHREAPNIDDAEFFWDWLIAQETSCYGTYWFRRASAEYEEIFNESLVDILMAYDLADANLIIDLHNYLNTKHPNVAIHFGEGKLNPSTLAGLIKQFLIKLIPEHYEYEKFDSKYLESNPIRMQKYY